MAQNSPPACTSTRGGRPPGLPGGTQERFASWLRDLTTLHELTERLGRTHSLNEALHETLRAGATLVGARRALFSLRPTDGRGPRRLVGLGLGRAELGHLETVPRGPADHDGGDIQDGGHAQDGGQDGGHSSRDGRRHGQDGGRGGAGGPDGGQVHGDIAADERLDPRHREVAARLGFAASYTVTLAAAETPGRLGAAVWLYDRPAEPDARQRHLLALYLRHATQHITNRLELTRARSAVRTVREGLLPNGLPRLPGIALAVRHRSGPRGGGDFYDALALPEGALGLAVGAANGSGPSAAAAMGRLRAGLRAYAVMEGEDPVAVLSDLELLLRLTEPARAATALFGYAEPAAGRLVFASAGHPPPLVVGAARAEFAEAGLSAPLGMLACWEAPSVELDLAPGETVLLYSDGLLHRTGERLDRAFARLRSAALGASPEVRTDPEALADHVLHTMLPGIDAPGAADSPEDVVLLAARF